MAHVRQWAVRTGSATWAAIVAKQNKMHPTSLRLVTPALKAFETYPPPPWLGERHSYLSCTVKASGSLSLGIGKEIEEFLLLALQKYNGEKLPTLFQSLEKGTGDERFLWLVQDTKGTLCWQSVECICGSLLVARIKLATPCI